MSWDSCAAIALRANDIVKICLVKGANGAAELEGSQPIIGNLSSHVIWNYNSTVFVVNQNERVRIYKVSSESGSINEVELENIDVHNWTVKWIGISPKGSFVVVCYQLPPNEDHLNLYVWNVNTRDLVYSGKHPNLESNHFVWRDDERYRSVLSNGNMSIYEGMSDKTLFSCSMQSQEATVQFAPQYVCGDDLLAFAFRPADAKAPGVLKMVFKKGTEEDCRVIRCEVPNVDGLECSFSPSGKHVLLITSAQIDSMGENYGSIGDLWLSSCQDLIQGIRTGEWQNGSLPPARGSAAAGVEDDAVAEQPDKSSVPSADSCYGATPKNAPEKAGGKTIPPTTAYTESLTTADRQGLPEIVTKINKKMVQDAAWSPTADEFVVIEGKSPSECYLKSADGALTEEITRGYKNTIRWSPGGDMLALGGFGNLAGDLAFYWRTRGGNYQGAGFELVHQWRVACTVKCEWSPCGRYFFTASLWPRMRVDNLVKIWQRDGELLVEHNADVLHDVQWIGKLSPNEVPALPRPTKTQRSSKGADVFRPRNQSGSSDLVLIQKYMSGQMRLEDLPDEVQARLKSQRTSRGKASSKTPDQLKTSWRNRQEPSNPSGANTESEATPSEPSSSRKNGKKKRDPTDDTGRKPTDRKNEQDGRTGPDRPSQPKRSAAPSIPTGSSRVTNTRNEFGPGMREADPGLDVCPAPVAQDVSCPGQDLDLDMRRPIIQDAGRADEDPAHNGMMPVGAGPVAVPSGLPAGLPLEAYPRLPDALAPPDRRLLGPELLPSLDGGVMPPPPPPTSGVGDDNILSLLQQVLPASATVHIENRQQRGYLPGPRNMMNDGRVAISPAPRLVDSRMVDGRGAYGAGDSRMSGDRMTGDRMTGGVPQNVYGVAPPRLRPPPPPRDEKWLYVDPGGQIQGPFSRKQMKVWWDRGYFPHTLRVKQERDYDFQPLTSHFPNVAKAFSD